MGMTLLFRIYATAPALVLWALSGAVLSRVFAGTILARHFHLGSVSSLRSTSLTERIGRTLAEEAL